MLKLSRKQAERLLSATLRNRYGIDEKARMLQVFKAYWDGKISESELSKRLGCPDIDAVRQKCGIFIHRG